MNKLFMGAVLVASLLLVSTWQTNTEQAVNVSPFDQQPAQLGTEKTQLLSSIDSGVNDSGVNDSDFIERVELGTPLMPSGRAEFSAGELASEAIELALLELDQESLIDTIGTEARADLFMGNSNYTGDDTSDNSVGDAGFEDDFPDANYAYDDHSAEAYRNYSESFAR